MSGPLRFLRLPIAAILVALLPVAAAGPASAACSATATKVRSPNPGTTYNSLNAVDASSSSNVWAAGNQRNGGVDRTLVERLSGGAWTVVKSPNPSKKGAALYGIAVVSPSNVVATGTFDKGGVWKALAMHRSGSGWVFKNVPSPSATYSDLISVHAVGSKNMWAVGYYQTSDTYYRPLIEHFDGTKWTRVTAPDPGAQGGGLVDVSGTASDMWAVGFQKDGAGKRTTLIEHWNGSSWAVVSSPNVGSLDNVLHSVAVVSPTDIWAVGFVYTAPGVTAPLAMHYNGTIWTTVSTVAPGSAQNFFYAVAALASNDIFAGGYSYSPATSLLENSTGAGFTSVTSPAPSTNFSTYWDLVGLAGGELWGVGEWEPASGNDKTFIVHACGV